ncbi:MAG: hypothetical protein KDE54_15695 [Caldilineaceae bacterium]|nr:hypothetical protein [Caldilineaceae bacterium]
MIPLTAATMSQTNARPSANLWLASLYGGVITALLAALFVTFFKMENPPLYIIGYLLTGIGPVLGYALAAGRLGSSVKGIIGGLIGSIVPVLSILLWPILVGALDSTQSVGKLIIGSIIGAILGAIVMLVVANAMGQDPSWLGLGIVLLLAVWGGSCSAAMAAWAKG